MSVNAALLRELHRIHRQLSDLRSRLSRGPRQIQAAETSVKHVDEELASLKEKTTRTRVAADQKELQLRERENRIRDAKAKLNACSTNREYQAFLEQIAADEQANSVLSDEILELFDKISALQEQSKSVQTQRVKTEADLVAVKTRVEDEREGLEREIGRLASDLATAEAKLPGDFRIQYERLVKARAEESLAPVDGDCCGGCYQTLTTQTINELRMERPIFCRSCGCILYMPEGSE